MSQKSSHLSPLVVVLSLLLVAAGTYILTMLHHSPAPSPVPEAELADALEELPDAPDDGDPPLPPSHDNTLADLGVRPDWNSLDIWQETITRDDFEYLLTKVYTVDDSWKRYITIHPDHAIIRTDTRVPNATYRLDFSYELSAASPDRNWNAAGDLPPGTKDKPLAGVHIAIDPGHIGGAFAKIEERWFQIGDQPPVMEGNMTLQTAKIIKRQLRALGAKVYLIRKDNKPVSQLRPADYRDEAVAKARSLGILDEEKIQSLQEKLFYRTGEIRERARRVNLAFRPDIVLALHYNAESWADPTNPTLTENNHYHVLLHGALTSSELAHDDERYEMLVKILTRSHDEEKPVGAYIAQGFAQFTKLPAYRYQPMSSRAVEIKINGVEGLWARNLLANRLYQCPVIFLEPYVMNNQEVFDRVQLGDYEGTKMINGVERKSIFREYAESVVEALKAYYLDHRIIRE
ncbi:N-acetylmuramoyl-L-alanine amidase [Verrucomicrobiaceae bacterium 5K15]|uniref:N-acetylmuramoyl-L-alanine amidase n=1 Tax=Oceaniferula flava TaxID=2800421 RepID=A0AAE2S9I4_9BACT|nr:hypothetical protein [Oceaniferula flavus]MBK1853820.1 N-acetylmuramoyl-L-alanine amidase [Oceaniferula flavus]MBM1135126.1 N-acetylmuramoyl-L-alanine amidase [Oceaniferula flavus]